MSDFYDIFMEQPEDEVKEIDLSHDLFVNGSLNIFNLCIEISSIIVFFVLH